MVSQEPLPASREKRSAAIDSLSTVTRTMLEDADKQFFAYPDNLTDLLFEFVRAYPEAFGTVR